MESLGNALTQPFQGDRAGENTLALAAALAPRLNFGRNPLQQGEGDGLKNVLAGMSAMAGQRRKSAAESQVMAGLPDILAGRSAASSLPLGDLSPEIGKLFFDAVLKNEERRNPTFENRLAAMSHASAISGAGGDPLAAFRDMGLGNLMPGGQASASPPPPVRSPGAVGMLPAEALAPSLLNLPPTRTSRPFGFSRVEEDYMKPLKTPGETEARAIAAMNLTPEKTLEALRRQSETSVTLANDLQGALGTYHKAHEQIFGGVSNGIRIPGMAGSVQDFTRLMGLATNADAIEGRLANAQGREKQDLFTGVLPSDAELKQVRDGVSGRLGRQATYQETLHEWAKILVGRQARQGEPAGTR